MDDVTIYIPTRGRVSDQISLKLMPSAVRRQVVVVCDPGEQRDLERVWGSKVQDIIDVGHGNLSQKRQRCMDISPTDLIIFIDDNCKFHTVRDHEIGEGTKNPLKGIIGKHFTPKTRNDLMMELFTWIGDKLRSQRYGMVGVAHRSDHMKFAAEPSIPYIKEAENERFYGFWGVNRTLMRALPGKPRFDDVVLKQDFYMILQFLTHGIPTIKTYEFGFDKYGGANRAGGCSAYRDEALMESEARRLQALFPRFVKLVHKKSKSWNQGFNNGRIDVQIDWKKAYAASQRPKGFFI